MKMQIGTGIFCAWLGSRAKTGEESGFSKSETATTKRREEDRNPKRWCERIKE